MSGRAGFHERLDRADEVKGGSDRAFGLTVGGILLAIALVRAAFGRVDLLGGALTIAGLPLVALALAAPALLAPLNRAWTRLGLLLFRVMNPLVMGVIFVTTVIPTGLIMRALGKDPLRLRLDRGARSYWIERNPPGPSPDGMRDQF
jgi:hypothetical protein